MTTRLNFKPGQKGTGKRAEINGDCPVCARERYDRESVKPYRTAELIVKEAAWQPHPKTLPGHCAGTVHELDLQALTQKAGGRWDPKALPRYVPYGKIAWTRGKGRIALDAKESRLDKRKGI